MFIKDVISEIEKYLAKNKKSEKTRLRGRIKIWKSFKRTLAKTYKKINKKDEKKSAKENFARQDI